MWKKNFKYLILAYLLLASITALVTFTTYKSKYYFNITAEVFQADNIQLYYDNDEKGHSEEHSIILNGIPNQTHTYSFELKSGTYQNFRIRPFAPISGKKILISKINITDDKGEEFFEYPLTEVSVLGDVVLSQDGNNLMVEAVEEPKDSNVIIWGKKKLSKNNEYIISAIENIGWMSLVFLGSLMFVVLFFRITKNLSTLEKTSLEKIELIVLMLILFRIFCLYLEIYLDISPNYLPTWSDEFGYYWNSQFFAENFSWLHFSLQGGSTLGDGSRLFMAGPHGSMYYIFHGLIAKLFTWSNLNFIRTYFFLIFVVIALIFTFKMAIWRKLSVAILILGFPFLLPYMVTYMQETIYIFFSIVIFIFLHKIYQPEIANKNRNKIIFIFFVFIFLASIYKPFFLFYSIALLPLSKNKKEFFIFSFFCLLSLVCMVLIGSFFMEKVPLPNQFPSIIVDNIHNPSQLVNLIFSHFQEQLDYFLSFRTQIPFQENERKVLVFTDWFLVSSVLLLPVYAIYFRDRLALGIFFLGFALHLLVFFMYNTHAGVRSLVGFAFVYLLYIAFYRHRILVYLHIFLLLFCLPYAYGNAKDWVNARNEIGNRAENPSIFSNYQELTALSIQKDITIQIHYLPRDYSLDFLALPTHLKNKFRIFYVVPYYGMIRTLAVDYHLYKTEQEIDLQKEEVIIKNNIYTLTK